MRIAFATLYDPQDPRRGSGTFYFMSRELERQGHDVQYLGPVDYSYPPLVSRLLKRLALFVGKRYRSFQDVFIARQIGAWIDTHMQAMDAEVLLTNDYAIAGFSSCRCPVVLYTDAVFPRRYQDVEHPWLADLFLPNVLSCQHVTRRGLERAMLWCYPSDWAIRTALAYGVRGGLDRVERIEFGSNLPEQPDAEIAASRRFSAIADRRHLRVLFVGNRDWPLKGGDVAVATVANMRQQGLDASLDLVGARPPQPLEETWIRVHGEIDKRNEPQRLSALYRDSDLLLVPTRAEGFGIVFVEAAAHGLPSLSYDSGTGVNNAIRHGESGVLLPLDSDAAAFADEIRSWYLDPARYDRLVTGARDFYQTVANWPTAIEHLVRAIETRMPNTGDRATTSTSR